ncbi:MAG: type II toxin-antitoxin system RelE/ParE family toxin [Pseudomonadota bacterium]
MKVLFYVSASGRSPVEEYIRSLPKADQARFVDVFHGISAFGLQCPRIAFRQLHGKLWEIKFAARGGGYRICYVVADGENMIWLHVFRKKTRKTPLHDVAVAERRMKEVLCE